MEQATRYRPHHEIVDLHKAKGKSNDIQVWYHADCDDGFGAAWAARRFFETYGIKNVKYVPVYYGKDTPKYTPETDIIYIVDFSYPRHIIEQIKKDVAHLVVLDHHKTAEKELQGLPYCTFDMKRSGAMITWNFFSYETAPKLIRYVQANDLWQHSTMPHCKEVVRFIRSFGHNFEEWDMLHALFETNMDSVFKQAEALERAFQQQVDFHMQFARDTVLVINGDSPKEYTYKYICPLVNSIRIFSSELLRKLIKERNTKMAMSYYIKPDGSVEASIRGDGSVDVSAIAKQFGGGGHADAAGFVMPLQQFTDAFLM